MPLRARLALLFSIATAVAITAAGSLFVYQLGDNLYDTLGGQNLGDQNLRVQNL